jgi:hypothetical protein
VGIGISSTTFGFHANKESFCLGLPYASTTATSTNTTGVGLYTSAGYDAVGTTHTILYASYAPNGGSIGDNFSGMLYVFAKNKSTGGRTGVAQLAINKRASAAVTSSFVAAFASNMPTFTQNVSGGTNIVIGTDSDVCIAWSFFVGI